MKSIEQLTTEIQTHSDMAIMANNLAHTVKFLCLRKQYRKVADFHKSQIEIKSNQLNLIK